MKKELLKLMMLALIAMPFASCGNDDEPENVPEEPDKETPEEPSAEKPDDGEKPDDNVAMFLPVTKPISLTEAQKDFVARSNDFSFNFYRAVNNRERSSNITSPLSVGYLLGMMNDGAQGQTSDEICRLLGYEAGDKASFDAFCRRLMEEAPQVDPSVTLRIANTVVANKQVQLEELFKEQVQQNYFAGVNSLDFSQPSALDWINNWCNEQTGGMIPKLADNLDPSALMVLMNAVYFNATWSDKFEKENTKEEKFFGGDKSPRVPMMFRQALALYAQNDIYSIIDLPYGGGENFMSWNIYFLLPQEGKTVDDVVNSLSDATWKETLDALRMYALNVWLPRYATQSDLTLNDVISNMGAPTMFSPESADFSPMTKNFKKADGQSLWVGLMKQKTAMKVTEDGTELSTVTNGIYAHGAMKPHADFHANRPFVYVVQEASSGVIFFIGTFRGD